MKTTDSLKVEEVKNLQKPKQIDLSNEEFKSALKAMTDDIRDFNTTTSETVNEYFNTFHPEDIYSTDIRFMILEYSLFAKKEFRELIKKPEMVLTYADALKAYQTYDEFDEDDNFEEPEVLISTYGVGLLLSVFTFVITYLSGNKLSKKNRIDLIKIMLEVSFNIKGDNTFILYITKLMVRHNKMFNIRCGEMDLDKRNFIRIMELMFGCKEEELIDLVDEEKPLSDVMSYLIKKRYSIN